jgi:hypothetical protein
VVSVTEERRQPLSEVGEARDGGEVGTRSPPSIPPMSDEDAQP